MSNESNSSNFRLLGSPVNLSYRGKHKIDKKSAKNRPHSALQNPGYVQENHERYRRPFSADGKDRAPSTRNLLNIFTSDLLQSIPIYPPNNVKVVPPTTELLGDKKSHHSPSKGKEVCSNASDYGSEDTYISLGTKIKARAQSPKAKSVNKIPVKFRNPTKKGKKPQKNINEKIFNSFGLDVKIVEKDKNTNNMFTERCNSPYFNTRPYASYFLSLDGKDGENSLAGRVSFGAGSADDIQSSIDTYTHRLSLTKQQLSLVEEECTQDLESVQSQNVSSLSAENSIEDTRDTPNDNDDRDVYIVDNDARRQNGVSDTRGHQSINNDNNSGKASCKCEPAGPNDTASKDSGYPDSGTNEESGVREVGSRKRPAKQSNLREDPFRKSQSLNCTPSPVFDSDTASEPLNHSRLLYKDFFLRKEGHAPVAPVNSPHKKADTPGPIVASNNESRNKYDDMEYPEYLRKSNTKAYTSKVIEDYKKEIAAINNLHELTIKDINSESTTPTQLNIDKLFTPASPKPAQPKEPEPKKEKSDKPPTEQTDVTNISTNDIIQNYWKVKEGDYSKKFNKNTKKNINLIDFEESSSYKPWGSKDGPKNSQKEMNSSKNQNSKNIFTIKSPLSARIESVSNDKDVESWMSLAAPSPSVFDDEILDVTPPKSEEKETVPEHGEVENITPKTDDDKQTKEETLSNKTVTLDSVQESERAKPKELNNKSTVLDIYSMLKEIENLGENHTRVETVPEVNETENKDDRPATPKDQYMEIFQFLESVEQSANDALSVVTTTTPQTIPKLESLLKLPATELAQRLVTASLQLDERSCCIALLQESLATHKEQMVNKISNLEKQSARAVTRVKHECEEAIKRHQTFIDQLINDKRTLNHRIEQLVDERRSLEEKWRRSAQSLEDRYKLELKNQHDKMAAAQQLARQRWVRQKAEKIKELTVKGLEGELREMADRQQKEIADLKMAHAERLGSIQAKHNAELEELRKMLEEDKENALIRERQMASARLEKQILELEATYQSQRSRLVAELRADNERVASQLANEKMAQTRDIEKWKEEQEMLLEQKRQQMEEDIAREREQLREQTEKIRKELEAEFLVYRQSFEAEQQRLLKKKVTEIAAQHKIERDREIEKAIESMEAEAAKGRKEMQEALRRNKEQYESELSALGETEKATLRRYQEAQARVRQTEDKCAELEVLVNQLETRNKILTEKNIELDNQIESVRASCEASWRERLDLARKEAEDAKRAHEEQMHQLYAKVKVAVARKDSAIQALTREAAKSQEKITTLEQKLQQQRKDFLKHK